MGIFAERARARSVKSVFRAVPALAAFLLATGVALLAPRALMAGEPDDISAYQAQYGPPPPCGAYPGGPVHAYQNLIQHLNYAEARYVQARQAGDREATRHWRKQIKRLRRELSGSARTARAVPYWAPLPEPPHSSYAGPGYSGYEYRPPYMPAPYPPQTPPVVAVPYGQPALPSGGYAGGPAATPFGSSAAPGSGGLASLVGPLLGGGSAQSPVAYPAYQGPGYSGPGYPAGAAANGAASAPTMGGIGSLLGPLLGAHSAP